jgi:hypothetical protein
VHYDLNYFFLANWPHHTVTWRLRVEDHCDAFVVHLEHNLYLVLYSWTRTDFSSFFNVNSVSFETKKIPIQHKWNDANKRHKSSCRKTTDGERFKWICKKKIFVFLICFGSENFFEVYIKVITEKCPEKPWQFSNHWKKQKMKENKKSRKVRYVGKIPIGNYFTCFMLTNVYLEY